MRQADKLDFEEDLYLTVRELLARGSTVRSVNQLFRDALTGTPPARLAERCGRDAYVAHP